MRLKNPSESGQPCGFVPCAQYAILEAKLGHTKFLQERIRKRYEILRKKCLKLRQERDMLQVCYKAAESSRRLAIAELNALWAVVEKADALAKEMTDLYTPMTYDGDRLDHVCCYCGAEEKEPHKIGCQHEASMKALAAYQEARHG